MSELYVDNIKNRTGGPVGMPTGAVVTGVITATQFNGDYVNTATVGSSTTISSSGVNVTGFCTASYFVGDGSGLVNVATNSVEGFDVRNNGSVVGVAQTIDFGSNLDVSPASAGFVTITRSSNITAESAVIGPIGSATTISSGGVNIAGIATVGTAITVGSGVTISGTSGITLNESTNASHIINPLLINFAEKVNALGNIDGGKTIDVADGTYVTATLNQDAPTITLASPPSGKLYGFALQLTNGSGGPYSLTFSGSGTIKWPGGSIPVRTTTDAKTDIWSFFTSDGGSNWYGSISLYNFS